MKKTVGILVVALAIMLVFAGCDNSSGGDVTYPEEVYDIVVVGSGISGYSATIAAKVANPNVNLVLIEKNEYLGGITRTSGGGWGNHILNADGQTEQVFTDAYKLLMKGSTNDTTHINFIDSADVKYPNYPKLYNIAKQARAAYTFLKENGLPASGGGGVLITALDTYVTDTLQVPTLTECKALDLLTDGGKVIGVRVNDNGTTKDFLAKKVILATGGFHQSPKLVSDWAGNYPGLTNVVTDSAPSNSTGDGIVMAKNIGADLYDSTFTELWAQLYSANLADIPDYAAGFYSPSFVGYGSPLFRSNQIVVDCDGVRFRPEQSFGGFGQASSYYMITRNKGPYWVIYSSNDPSDTVSVGGEPMNILAALDAAATSSKREHTAEVKKADTLTALATAMGMTGTAATTFVQTVTAYEATVGGSDADSLGKPANIRDKHFTTGPFYAIKLYPCTFDSTGGVATDEYGRVLKSETDPTSIIPNLYAIGAVSNRDFYQQTYVGGTSLSMYSTIGRIVGKHAVDNLNN
jgi:thioredoxin reductase